MHLCMFLLGFILPGEVKDTQSCPTLATHWTVACKFPRPWDSPEEYWSGLPFPSPGDLPKPGIKPMSPALQADSLLTELGGKPIILPGTLQFLDLGDCFLFHVREILSYDLFRYFLKPFLSSSGTSIMQMLVKLMLSRGL